MLHQVRLSAFLKSPLQDLMPTLATLQSHYESTRHSSLPGNKTKQKINAIIDLRHQYDKHNKQEL